ncbi:MAG: MBOAT family protein [Lachnospiraceae bacterium]|nr:MBOAT family protein [Lachnospiraceae bacterium]
MVFSSLLFLFRFLPLVLLVYFLAPGRVRNFILFIFSLIFYAWGEPYYVVLILLSTVIDYTAGRLVDKFLSQENRKKAKWAVAGSVIMNLGLLGFFKYGDFLINIVNAVTPLDIGLMELALPIGISFYTFQTMSYTIDVYRGEAKVQKNFIAFGAYVAMFPQLIAGPIVRYQTIAEELNARKENLNDFSKGILKFIVGLGKKVLIANQVGMVFSEIAAMQTDYLSTASAWLGVAAFTLQIYFDFSGYSDMAIGLGLMLGFHFPENFNYPYESKSITEFWRRWHISLGTWFREYVYIPLGGNKKGTGRQILNLAVVWLLTGLWHGASWNFVIWGLYYGILLVLEKSLLGKCRIKLPGFVKRLYTLFFVMVGWALFSIPDMADGTGYLKTMFGLSGNGLADRYAGYIVSSNWAVFLIALAGSTSLMAKLCGQKLFPENTARRDVAASVFSLGVLAVSVAFLVNAAYNPFLYFRF